MSNIIFEKLTVKETGKVFGGYGKDPEGPAGIKHCGTPSTPDMGCIVVPTSHGLSCINRKFTWGRLRRLL